MNVPAPQSYGFNEFLLDLVKDNSEPQDVVYNYICNVKKPRFDSLYSRLKKVRDIKVKGKKELGRKSNLVGRIFEQLLATLIDGCKILRFGANVRTTVGELDFLLHIEALASAVPMFRTAGAHAIGEAKCYTTGMKSEWLNEFAGILPAHQANLGILFMAAPSKKLRSDHRTIIGLHAARGIFVVPFGMKQLDAVKNGENFLKLLCTQHSLAMTLSTSLSI